MPTLAMHEPVLGSEALLHIERTDLEFHDVPGGRVALRVTLTNRGTGPSPETAALLSAAPFGAFVPWRPLGALAVPALEPGESHVLRAEAVRVKAKPLGPPDRVPPRRLLTALGADDPRPD